MVELLEDMKWLSEHDDPDDHGGSGSSEGSCYGEGEEREDLMLFTLSNSAELLDQLPEEFVLQEDPRLYPKELNCVPNIYRGTDNPYDPSMTCSAACTISIGSQDDGWDIFGDEDGLDQMWVTYASHLDSQFPHH